MYTVCSIYKQNQMRTMNSDSNVVNNFNWASPSLFFISRLSPLKYMLYKYIWFCYKYPTKATLCLLLQHTCRFYLDIISNIQLIWPLDFLMSLTICYRLFLQLGCWSTLESNISLYNHACAISWSWWHRSTSSKNVIFLLSLRPN